MVEEDISAGHLTELMPEWQATALSVHLVYPWARYYPTRLRKFLDLMKEVMPALTGMRHPTGDKKPTVRSAFYQRLFHSTGCGRVAGALA